MAFQSFEDTALRLADKCGLVAADFYEITGTMFVDSSTTDEALDLFQQSALSILGNTKVTKGKYEHSIDFVA